MARPLNSALWSWSCAFDAEDVVAQPSVMDPPTEPGNIQNFLGTRSVAGNAEMTRLIKKVLMRTHSRIQEGLLMTHFDKQGPRLKMARPAVMAHKGGLPKYLIDGVQIWTNPALVAV